MNEWPHFLADLKNKRDCLNEVIAILEKNFTAPDGGADLLRNGSQQRGSVKQGRQTNGTERNGTERNGATRVPRPRVVRSLPDDAVKDKITAQLRKHGPMKPGDLAKAVGLSSYALRTRLNAMTASVEVTGITMSRRIALKGHTSKPAGRPAKEEP